MRATRLLPLALLAACLTDPGDPPDALPGAPAADPFAVTGWPLDGGGAAGEGDVAAPVAPPAVPVLVFDTMTLTREVEPGVAPGYDLDERTSAKGDSLSCGHADFVSPTGAGGVDNQLALIVPLLEFAGLGAVEALIQAAIEDGGLLFMFQVSGLDDPVDDPQVDLTFRVGQGKPLLGTDGLLLAGQTFEPNPEFPSAVVPNGRVVDGWLEGGPFHAKVLIVVFGVRYELRVLDARFRARVGPDGTLTEGLLGGGVPVDDLLVLAQTADGGQQGIYDVVAPLVTGSADMLPADGACTRLSAALTFSAKSAWLME